jgi:hypothetical protein
MPVSNVWEPGNLVVCPHIAVPCGDWMLRISITVVTLLLAPRSSRDYVAKVMPSQLAPLVADTSGMYVNHAGDLARTALASDVVGRMRRASHG